MELIAGQEYLYFGDKISVILKLVFIKYIAYLPNLGYCTCRIADHKELFLEPMIPYNSDNTVKGVTRFGDMPRKHYAS